MSLTLEPSSQLRRASHQCFSPVNLSKHSSPHPIPRDSDFKKPRIVNLKQVWLLILMPGGLYGIYCERLWFTVCCLCCLKDWQGKRHLFFQLRQPEQRLDRQAMESSSSSQTIVKHMQRGHWAIDAFVRVLQACLCLVFRRPLPFLRGRKCQLKLPEEL